MTAMVRLYSIMVSPQKKITDFEAKWKENSNLSRYAICSESVALVKSGNMKRYYETKSSYL